MLYIFKTAGEAYCELEKANHFEWKSYSNVFTSHAADRPHIYSYFHFLNRGHFPNGHLAAQLFAKHIQMAERIA